MKEVGGKPMVVDGGTVVSIRKGVHQGNIRGPRIAKPGEGERESERERSRRQCEIGLKGESSRRGDCRASLWSSLCQEGGA